MLILRTHFLTILTPFLGSIYIATLIFTRNIIINVKIEFSLPLTAPGQFQNTGHRESMSDSTMADIFQDYLSSFSALRTGQVLTIIVSIITTLGTIFLNTIYKLLILAGAKLMADVAVIAFLKHYPLSSVADILLGTGSTPFISIGDGLLSRTPLINIEEANILYSSPGVEFLGRGDYGGRFQFVDVEEEEKDEPVYVYREGKKRRSGDLSVLNY